MQAGEQIREVSESAFEYLLGEILGLPRKDNLSDADQKSSMLVMLDTIGYDVGYKYVERTVSPAKPLGSEPIDAMKFVCKEFWEEVFKKKIDKLQTDHNGKFVLSDYKFKWLDRYTSDDPQSKQAATELLNFPCGILRGALANLGFQAIVHADFSTLPAVKFSILVKT